MVEAARSLGREVAVPVVLRDADRAGDPHVDRDSRVGGNRIPPGRHLDVLVALFSVGIVPQALQRPDSTHLSWVTCISFPLLILAVVEYVGAGRPTDHTAATTVGAGVATALALTLVVAPLFTFRYYLLHTRVSAGNVQNPVPGVSATDVASTSATRAVPGQPRI